MHTYIYITDRDKFDQYAWEKCKCQTACNVEEYTTQSTIYKFPNHEYMRRQHDATGKESGI